MAVLAADELPTLSLLYKLGKLKAPPPGREAPATISYNNTTPTPSKALNDRVSVYRGDITKLEVDAIVNAANESLLGGGGVDGAIHNAAGPGLLAECRKLNGCDTGSAKITGAYNLPCKKVIHAVGPVYNFMKPKKSAELLTGCYTTSLELAVANGLKTIAFSALSTGIYGYPSSDAAPVAISAVKKFLESDNTLEKVVFVTFVQKDVDAYDRFLPLYFPPVPEASQPAPTDPESTTGGADEAAQEAEAEKVASKLPDVPKADPDSEHADKKQKHDT